LSQGERLVMYQGLFKSVKAINISALAYLFLFFSSNIYAAEDITDVWTGTVIGNNFSCTDPADDGLFTAVIALQFSNQNGDNFNVSFSGTDDADGEPFEAIGSGSFSSATTLDFSANFTDGGSIAMSISLNGVNALTFSFSGGGGTDGCGFTGGGSATRVSGGLVVNPANTASSTLTQVLTATQMQGQMAAMSTRTAQAVRGKSSSGGVKGSKNKINVNGSTGVNAGDGFAIPYGVWGSYSYTDYKNDLSSTAFDGTSYGFFGGIDFGFLENTIIGVAFGYDSGDIDTTFNRGNQQTDTYTIAPYFGALLTDSLSLDFAVGYSKVEYDQFRTLAATRITSAPNADRWFGAFNLNAIKFYDKWIVGGRVGASYASSKIDSYTESNGSVVADSRTRLSTVSLAGDIAYSYGDYEPFLNLSYQNDFSLRKITVTSGPQPSNDTDDILMTTGVRYFSKNGVTGNLEYSKRFLRDNFDEDRISLTIRADF